MTIVAEYDIRFLEPPRVRYEPDQTGLPGCRDDDRRAKSPTVKAEQLVEHDDQAFTLAEAQRRVLLFAPECQQ
jgi:hypothetical protein